jgi:hypothetical protein
MMTPSVFEPFLVIFKCKNMAYEDFSFQDFREKFGYEDRVQKLFSSIKLIKPSKRLVEELKEAKTVPLHNKKAKSEWIVVPILKEIRRLNADFLTIYSGEPLDADIENGLNGVCDFIISKNIKTYTISYPIMLIVEAPKGDVDLGIARCAAQMIGAKVYNEQKGTPVDIIYGCVTNANDWVFLQLSDKIIIDTQTYSLTKLGELLGVFQTIIDYYKATIK